MVVSKSPQNFPDITVHGQKIELLSTKVTIALKKSGSEWKKLEPHLLR